jgi:hypothetical protein
MISVWRCTCANLMPNTIAENGAFSRAKSAILPFLEPDRPTQAHDLEALMSAGSFGARDLEKWRAPFSNKYICRCDKQRPRSPRLEQSWEPRQTRICRPEGSDPKGQAPQGHRHAEGRLCRDRPVELAIKRAGRRSLAHAKIAKMGLRSLRLVARGAYDLNCARPPAGESSETRTRVFDIGQITIQTPHRASGLTPPLIVKRTT